MITTHIEKTTLKFLKDLAKNNDRVWFKASKNEYDYALANMKGLIESIETELNKIDMIEKKKVFRIYRDVRFSKDKTPYKDHLGGSFTRATAARRGGYFLGIQPGNKSIIAGGFWNPESTDIKRVREELALDPSDFRKIINAKKFKDLFGQLEGQSLKNIPRGFDKESPAGDLLRMKQYLCYRPVSDKEIIEPDFLKKVVDTYRGMLPFFNFMSSVLTTNLNGESLID
ncbi:MAG TPA: TIGR02453 family protein [Saprospirales bacterium]|jgi:uncharacterized protein (TIGR02453 family)|nr:DUF2461 domain-containing protein [Saprospiraceae bacterium]HAV30324.1 TIGR02453 family protein [Saprospirales bacterium]HAW04666.1 TIGR02453 family protein [Saprospirales bacterium]